MGGETVAEQRYLPFGGLRWRTHTPLPADRQYTGQRWDEALGLYDYKARYYDPALARFIQPLPQTRRLSFAQAPPTCHRGTASIRALSLFPPLCIVRLYFHQRPCEVWEVF